jgi:gamma-glutamyltranspeptidase/glutathione hydrolase
MRRSLFAAASLAIVLIGAAAPIARAQRGPAPAPSPALAKLPATVAGAVFELKSGTAAHAMVSAANPLAVQTGVKVLKAGGSALDAAVAIQMVLGLVEPQSSGVGGGAFLTYYDAKTRKITAYDGRETAPAGASPDMFLGDDGKPMPFGRAVVSGRATGVPGAVAMLYMAHKDYGKLPWAGLFADAQKLASDGFVVSPRLANFLAMGMFPQSTQPDVLKYFTKPDGQKYQAGDVLKNQPYADTLALIARQGPDALLKGKIAADIVARTTADPLAGTMTLADLAGYKPLKSEALCIPYRVYTLCTPQAPSGGPAVLELMGILQNTDLPAHGVEDPQGWYLFAEASRLAYADRDLYEGDPAFVNPLVKSLLDPAYLKARAALIGATAIKTVQAGKPVGAVAMAADHTVEPGGTSSYVVVDQWGDVMAITTTVESIFGTGRMVDGFFVNNQLTDFSFAPKTPVGLPAANAVGGGKRPRSSMSPTIVLDKDRNFVASVGSPGGGNIVGFVSKALVALIDWKLPMPVALAIPNLIGHGDIVTPETELDPAIMAGLAARGVNLAKPRGEESGLHGIQKVKDGTLLGGADPRREGIAEGF